MIRTDSVSDNLRPRPAPAADAPSPSPVKNGRTVLPIHATATITGKPATQEEADERAAHKAVRRVVEYHRSRTVQETLQFQTTRGPTRFQGARETDGDHASHISLAPGEVDDLLARVTCKVASIGITPKKTEPYLKAKRILPQAQQAVRDHPNSPDKIKRLLMSFLSPHKRKSVKAGTHLDLDANATIGNPKEANGFDCLLERVIRPIADKINERVGNGEISALEATKELVGELIGFYRTSMHNNLRRTVALDRFIRAEATIDKFHETYVGKDDIPQEELGKYCEAIRELLVTKELLSTRLPGTSTVRDFRLWRDDYGRLETIKEAGTVDAFKQEMQRYRKPRSTVDRKERLKRYQAYLKEGTLQYNAVRTSFRDDADVEQLRTQLFGIYDPVDKVRRKPNTPEVERQVFDMIALRTPAVAPPPSAAPDSPEVVATPVQLDFGDAPDPAGAAGAF